MQCFIALTADQIGELGNWGIGLAIGLVATLLGFGVIPTTNVNLNKNLNLFKITGPLILVISMIFIIKAFLSR